MGTDITITLHATPIYSNLKFTTYDLTIKNTLLSKNNCKDKVDTSTTLYPISSFFFSEEPTTDNAAMQRSSRMLFYQGQHWRVSVPGAFRIQTSVFPVAASQVLRHTDPLRTWIKLSSFWCSLYFATDKWFWFLVQLLTSLGSLSLAWASCFSGSHSTHLWTPTLHKDYSSMAIPIWTDLIVPGLYKYKRRLYYTEP